MSYNPTSCTGKLNTDSKIVAKASYAKTKTETTVNDLLAHHTVSIIKVSE